MARDKDMQDGDQQAFLDDPEEVGAEEDISEADIAGGRRESACAARTPISRTGCCAALADAENVRKRADRDRRDAEVYGATRLARDLLSVHDNFARALEAV